MSAVVKPSEGTDLQKVERAIAGMDKVRAGLEDLTSQYGGVIYPVQTRQGLEDAKRARAAIREPRYEVERIRKEAKAPILAIGRQLDATAAEITRQIQAIEAPICQQIEQEEARIEAERQAKIRIEAERQARHRERIQWITSAPVRAAGKSAAIAEGLLRDLQAAHDPGSYEEFEANASQAFDAAVKAMQTLIAERHQYEADQAELARQRIENERLRTEQAERDRIEREAREAENRARREAQDKADAEARAQLQRDRAELEQRQRAQDERERVAREKALAEAEAKAAAAARRRKVPPRPPRKLIIGTIGKAYFVSDEIAEKWLVEIFSKEVA